MADRIVLANMRFEGRHGVREWERETAQPFELDVELVLDLRPAAEADDVARTVDYGAVYARCREIVETRSYGLIEALAGAIAADLLGSFRPVDEVVVRVRKPGLALTRSLDSAGVEIARHRSG